jgi:hypothetical protein
MSALAIPAFSIRPVYEFRLAASPAGVYEYSIWRAGTTGTVTRQPAERVAALRGPAAQVVETRILRLLARAGVKPGPIRLGEKRTFAIGEDWALTLALLLRVLGPMRDLDQIREVAERIEDMSREEAGYWLGLSIYRDNPRRVMAALRLLLTSK